MWVIPVVSILMKGANWSNPGILTDVIFIFPTESVPVKNNIPEKFSGGVQGLLNTSQDTWLSEETDISTGVESSVVIKLNAHEGFKQVDSTIGDENTSSNVGPDESIWRVKFLFWLFPK